MIIIMSIMIMMRLNKMFEHVRTFQPIVSAFSNPDKSRRLTLASLSLFSDVCNSLKANRNKVKRYK